LFFGFFPFLGTLGIGGMAQCFGLQMPTFLTEDVVQDQEER